MKYTKINIFLRQTSHNKLNSGRPEWFDYEKTFINLLKTINFSIANLYVVFDGDITNHFTLEYQNSYPFIIKFINTKDYQGKSYENDGSSKSGALVARLIKELNLPENELIYILENDYVHLPYFCEATLDFYNSIQNSDKYLLSLYDHLDKYIFTQIDRNDEWGMYKRLISKIFLSNFRHWREVPSICSSWIMTKSTFEVGYDFLFIGVSDNTFSGDIMKERGYLNASPIPALATHCQLPFIAPFIDWKVIINL